jgi:hypothetical protein
MSTRDECELLKRILHSFVDNRLLLDLIEIDKKN